MSTYPRLLLSTGSLRRRNLRPGFPRRGEPVSRFLQLSGSDIPAWARIPAWVPGFRGSRPSGTITVIPASFLSLRWLPLVETTANPFRSSSLIMSWLDRRGLRGLKLPGW